MVRASVTNLLNIKERKTNVTAIMKSVEGYLDHNSYLGEVTGEYHVVVFSASGGSGSVIAPLLMANLRTRNIPTIAVTVGDSSNGLSCKNTLNTLATLDHMAKRMAKKPFSIYYLNNFAVDTNTAAARELTVNESIYNALSVFSLFLSGDNEDIDTKDMVNFLSPDNYSTITIAPALYSINIFTNGNIKNDPNAVNLIGRTLTAVDESYDMDITLLQHKHGRVVMDNVTKVLGDITPIHLILAGECLKAEHKALTNTVEEYDNIMNSITSTDLGGTDDASDCGLIL